MIGGGAALATGLVLGVTVINSDAELSAACPGGLCPPPGRDADVENAQRRAVIADALGGVGIAALAAGVVLWFVRAPHATAPRTAVVFTGRGVAGSWTF